MADAAKLYTFGSEELWYVDDVEFTSTYTVATDASDLTIQNFFYQSPTGKITLSATEEITVKLVRDSNHTFSLTVGSTAVVVVTSGLTEIQVSGGSAESTLTITKVSNVITEAPTYTP